jgi:hypothetical protein
MIIVCQKCSTRLQVDEEKSPARPSTFVVRNVTARSVRVSRVRRRNTARLQSADRRLRTIRASNQTRARLRAGGEDQSNESCRCDAGRRRSRVVGALSKGTSQAPKIRGETGVGSRKALVCDRPRRYRETIAQRLTRERISGLRRRRHAQAIETMRSNKMDVVLLDPQFDPAEQVRLS